MRESLPWLRYVVLFVFAAGGCRPGAIPAPSPTPVVEPTLVGLGRTWTRPADDMVMVYVPAGEFEMGGTQGWRDELPVHTVALDGFWMDRTEVTNGQYQRCVATGVCEPPSQTDSRRRETYYGDDTYTHYPVVKVSWYSARDYCGWVGARLPTEAEWEYAARGSDGYTYPWGNDAPDCDKANYWNPEGGCPGETMPVGSYPAGASWCGMYDLAGNVSEWVADRYGDYPAERQVNPQGPSAGRYRVIRGGSWFQEEYSLRSSDRDRDPAKTPYVAGGGGFYSLGFRCAQSAE